MLVSQARSACDSIFFSSTSELETSCCTVCWVCMKGTGGSWGSSSIPIDANGSLRENMIVLYENMFFSLLELYPYLVCHVLNVNGSGVFERERYGETDSSRVQFIFPNWEINLEVSFLPVNLFPPKRMISHHNFKNNFLKKCIIH